MRAIQWIDRFGQSCGPRADKRIQLRVTPVEDAVIRRRAAVYGLRVGDYLLLLARNEIMQAAEVKKGE